MRTRTFQCVPALPPLNRGREARVHHGKCRANTVASAWGRLRDGDQAWPDARQWEQLRAADRLEHLVPPADVAADDQGRVEVTFELPMPSMSFLRLTPR